ncbi:MAG: CHAT domain-containing protein, partial [Bacteroidales bacterium]|nr:CHAT domain-containing protein [Bacteroidales bacterium]
NSPKQMLLKARLSALYYENLQIDESRLLKNECTEYLQHYPDPFNIDLIDLYLEMADAHVASVRSDSRTEKYTEIATHILENNFPPEHYRFGILNYLRAIISKRRLDYTNAVHYYNLCINTSPSVDRLVFFQIAAYQNLATLWLGENNPEEAHKIIREGIAKAEKAGMNTAGLYCKLGEIYIAGKLKDPKMVERYCRKAISLSASASPYQSASIRTDSYFNISRSISFRKEPEKMQQYLEKALTSSKEISNTGFNLGLIYHNMSWLSFQRGQYRQSLHQIQQSIIALCKNFTDTSGLANPQVHQLRPYLTLADIFSLKGNALYKLAPDNPEYLKAALGSLELAARIIEYGATNTREEGHILNLADQKKRVFNNAVFYATCLYQLTGKKVYAEKVLVYSEKSKMQLLRIKTARRDYLTQAGVPDSVIDMEEKLNAQMLELENSLNLLPPKSNKFAREKLVNVLSDIYNKRERLNILLEEKYHTNHLTAPGVQMANIDSIQQMLKKNQVILEYQLMHTELVTFLISRDTFQILLQTIPKTFYTSIQILHKIMSNGPFSSDVDNPFLHFTQASDELYHCLIKPFYRDIQGKRLIIIPHNELTQIPFEILISDLPDKNEKPDYRKLPYLIKEFPIAYAYSANFLLDQPNREFGRGTGIFLPDYNTYKNRPGHDNIQLLTGAEEEATAVRRISWGKLYHGRFADEIRFKRNASRFRALHIASHAVAEEMQHQLSYLLFSAPSDQKSDGLLYSFELQQMKINAQLVVLSGCNTGYGKLRSSEGMISLARSFFYTGVRTVVLTLWPVADNAGSQLMTSFYKNLKQQQTLDKALQHAKLDLINTADPVKAHPYYWANYIIIGRPEEVPIRKFPFRIAIAGIILTIALLLMALHKKIKI